MPFKHSIEVREFIRDQKEAYRRRKKATEQKQEEALLRCMSQKLEEYPELTEDEAKILCQVQFTENITNSIFPLDECVALQVSRGWDHDTAFEHCKTLRNKLQGIVEGKTVTKDQLVKEELSPELEKCVHQKTEDGMPYEEAKTWCRAELGLEEPDKRTDAEIIAEAQAEAEERAKRISTYAEARRLIYHEDIATSFAVAHECIDTDSPEIAAQVRKEIQKLHDFQACIRLKMRMYDWSELRAREECGKGFKVITSPLIKEFDIYTYQQKQRKLKVCIKTEMSLHDLSQEEAKLLCEKRLGLTPKFKEEDTFKTRRGLTVGDTHGLTKLEILDKQRRE